MPSIVLIIIGLIIKLAVEGYKEFGDDSFSSSSSHSRTKLDDKYDFKGTPEYKPKKHLSLSEMIAAQTVEAHKNASPKPMYTTTTVKEEPIKEILDTNDYEDFNTVKEEDIKVTESFVESSVKPMTTYEQRSNKIKLMIYMLVYCMWEDDNEFTRKEKRMFKVISKVASANLNKKDTEEIGGFIDERPNLDSIVRKQEAYKLDIVDVLDTTKDLRNHLKKNDQYNKILERIEKRFQYEL